MMRRDNAIANLGAVIALIACIASTYGYPAEQLLIGGSILVVFALGMYVEIERSISTDTDREVSDS